ncbi:FeoB-associated Cys-rich membrane protein [Methylobacterium sp. WL8]|uniref:FeoB-associated Cys-rich membrane protein n=1 Tax=Methylobacterium sp. WL8 TaxID=2603899 RepID=UPI0011CBD239|nr:FeoB-associated Cys-rich membrane protein [Methylobacterium sp. WL8]TXN78279.1 hypothetical protein FV234_22965 [Methylobacterium sp. WL8]
MPNAQATIDATADAYLKQGVLGATIVLLLIFLVIAGLVIRHLYNDLKAVNAITLADREKLILALGTVAAGDERDRELLQEMKTTLAGRTQALGDLSQQMALTAQETRHGFANIGQMVTGLLDLIRGIRAGGVS